MTCVKIKMKKKNWPFSFWISNVCFSHQKSTVMSKEDYFYLSLLVFHFSLLTNLLNDFFIILLYYEKFSHLVFWPQN